MSGRDTFGTGYTSPSVTTPSYNIHVHGRVIHEIANWFHGSRLFNLGRDKGNTMHVYVHIYMYDSTSTEGHTKGKLGIKWSLIAFQNLSVNQLKCIQIKTHLPPPGTTRGIFSCHSNPMKSFCGTWPSQVYPPINLVSCAQTFNKEGTSGETVID